MTTAGLLDTFSAFTPSWHCNVQESAGASFEFINVYVLNAVH